MNLWSIIKGAGKVGDVIDNTMKAADALVFTKEERAVATAKEILKNQEHMVTLAKMQQGESGASAVTRRIAMLIVLGNFSVFAQTALVAVIMGNNELATNVIKLAGALSIGYLSMTVVVSIFGYYSVTKKDKK